MARETGQSSAGFHRVQSFIHCPQKFAYREVMHVRPKVEPPAPALGTVLHEGLRIWYLGLGKEAAVQAIMEMPLRYGPYIEPGLLLLEAYLEHYSGEKLQVLDVEREFEVTISGRPFTRRVDLTIIGQDGRVYAPDHKTAAKPGARARSATRDWSLMTQDLVLRAVCRDVYGRDFGAVILNLVGTAEKEFHRRPLIFPPAMLKAAPRSLLHYIREIDRLKFEDPWSYPRSGECVQRYGVCEFIDLCEYGEASLPMYDVEEPSCR